ncbi:Non-catalytic module family DOC2 [Piromyces sp. E2]|nr:Non-catalytic module family DOC2 [Piromyces sp. E2]|eukprot:OUM64532.1 Non-catalytic module family DOC2 [Piromyces sp. E2]
MIFSKFLTFATYIVASSLVAADLTLTAGPVSCIYKSKDLNETFNNSSSVNIKCSGNKCTVNGSGATASNNLVTITAAGTYIVQGSLRGQFRIEASKNDFIHLILNNTTITNNNGPAIYGVNADKITITLIGNNKLIDSTKYTSVNEKVDACLFINSNLSINGSGSLNVTSKYANAIHCKKDLKLISGKITVPTATQKGIKAKNSICVMNATVDINSTDTSIKVTRNDNTEKGYIVIDDGNITISTNKKGIQAQTHLTINGGYINIKKSKEGLEGQMVDILGGEIHIFSTDDGINGTKISDPNKSSMENKMNKSGTDGSVYINIVGGKSYITVEDINSDGIDANGVLYIGGNAEVYVSYQGNSIYGTNSVFSSDGDNSIAFGATIIGLANGNSNQQKQQNNNKSTGKIYQPYIHASVSNQAAGTKIIVKDSSNNIIASFDPVYSYSSIIVTSPKIVAGKTYTIIMGNTFQTFKASSPATGTINAPSITTISNVTVTSPTISSPTTSTTSSNLIITISTDTATSSTSTSSIMNTTTTTTDSTNISTITSSSTINTITTTSNLSTLPTITSSSTTNTISPSNTNTSDVTTTFTTNIATILTTTTDLTHTSITSSSSTTSTTTSPSIAITTSITTTSNVIPSTTTSITTSSSKTSTSDVTITSTTTKIIPSSTSVNSNNCSALILNQGFKCCSNNCTVIYTDSDGSWGIENNQWCGCNNTTSLSLNCPSKIISQGYSCCQNDNCKVQYIDDDGKWGVENREWCGLSYDC